MSKSFTIFILFASLWSLFNCVNTSTAGETKGSFVQASTVDKNSNVRSLKASLNSCVNQHPVECKQTLKIKAWIDLQDDHEIFLIIDEIYDVEEQMNFPLLHPYMIQVSTLEQTSMQPLLLNQVVDVSCAQHEPVQRREADNDGALTDEGAETKIAFDLFSPLKILIEIFFFTNSGELELEDSSDAIREGDSDAIKRDFPDFNSANGADATRRGNDLLLYVQNARTTTVKVPFAGIKDVAKVQHQHDIASSTVTYSVTPGSGSYSRERNKIHIKFGDRRRPQHPMNELHSSENALASKSNVNEPISGDDFYRNDEFQFDGSPKRFDGKIDHADSATNPDRFPSVATHYRSNHQLTPSEHHRNRFYVNQNGNEAGVEVFDKRRLNAKLSGLINDPYSPQKSADGTKGYNEYESQVDYKNYPGNYAMKAPKNQPGLADFSMTFNGLQHRNQNRAQPFHQIKRTESGKHFQQDLSSTSHGNRTFVESFRRHI